MIPLITVPAELRSQSHSPWHFGSCPLLCLCSQLAAGNNSGHMQDKFLQGSAWSVQNPPHIVMRTARFTPVLCHQRIQKSFSHSSSFGRDSLVCANVSLPPGIPEMGLELHSAPASLGTTHTGIVHALDRSLSHTATPQGSTQQGRHSLEHPASSSSTRKKGNSLKKIIKSFKIKG